VGSAAQRMRVLCSNLCTRFPVEDACVSQYGCPLICTPHYKFARCAVQDVKAGQEISDGPGSGYGRYTRWEYWSHASKGNRDRPPVKEKGIFEGQWHHPEKYKGLIEMHKHTFGEQVQSFGQDIKVVRIKEGFEISQAVRDTLGLVDRYWIADGTHRAALLLALGFETIEVTCVEQAAFEGDGQENVRKWPNVIGYHDIFADEQALRIFDMDAPHNSPFKSK